MGMHRCQGYDASTLRCLGLVVTNYFGGGHLAMLAEKVLQLRAIHRERKIAH
jgi:hypothetical protein